MLTARGRFAVLAALMVGSLAVGIHGTPAAPDGPNPLQQRFTPSHESPATTVHSTAVSIRRANGRL